MRWLAAALGGEPQDLQPTLGPIADRLLLAEGIAVVDDDSRPVLLSAFALTLRDAFELRRRQAGGDYRPDPEAERFPDWRPRDASPSQAPTPSARMSLTGLLEDWWREATAAGRKPSTRQSYSNSVAALAAFLGHADAARVTPDDVLRIKDHRLASRNPRPPARLRQNHQG